MTEQNRICATCGHLEEDHKEFCGCRHKDLEDGGKETMCLCPKFKPKKMGKVGVEAINEQLEKQNLGELYKIREKLLDLIIEKERAIIKGNVPSRMFNQTTKKEVKS